GPFSHRGRAYLSSFFVVFVYSKSVRRSIDTTAHDLATKNAGQAHLSGVLLAVRRAGFPLWAVLPSSRANFRVRRRPLTTRFPIGNSTSSFSDFGRQIVPSLSDSLRHK